MNKQKKEEKDRVSRVSRVQSNAKPSDLLAMRDAEVRRRYVNKLRRAKEIVTLDAAARAIEPSYR